jgi:hypothetical protein
LVKLRTHFGDAFPLVRIRELLRMFACQARRRMLCTISRDMGPNDR